MKKNILLICLTCMFVLLLGATTFVSFSGNIDTQEVTVKSITPVYDETSGVVVIQDNVTFNDKNQVVDYKVVIENTQDYDVKINNINLSTPTEEFLSFQVEDIQENDVLKANSTKEIIVSFETMGIEGWGRNFSDELIANISFEKISKQEEVVPPTEDDKEETPEEETPKEDEPSQGEVPKEEPAEPNEGEESNKPIPQPEAPFKDNKELIKNVEKIEEIVVTTNTIELPKEIKVSVGEKIAIWIYSDPIFLGYFDVVVENGIKKIEGLEEALAETDIKAGEHNLVLVSNEETIGYIPVSINEDKELVTEDNKKDEAIENPYTSDNILVYVLGLSTIITGISLIIVSNNKAAKYTTLVILLSITLMPTKAEKSIELPITFSVKFESQNVMKASGCSYDKASASLIGCVDYWQYRKQIKNFYIQNEITEIKDVAQQFDVTEDQNGRVNAYLVTNKEDSNYYDLYLQADGVIYANENASRYFSEMENINLINNLAGIDTSNVTNMHEFFYDTGCNSTDFTLDITSLDTSNVTNMQHMFSGMGYSSTIFELDVSNMDTSKVTNMNSMFQLVGYSNPNFTLDVSGFNTSNVTKMEAMFNQTGYNSTILELDVSNFDLSKVTDMRIMFQNAGYNSTKLNTSITISNPNITIYSSMFNETATKPGSMIKVNYTTETEELVKKMIATKSANSNVVLGNLVVDVDNLSIGDEIHIRGEKFNVISQTDDTVTMLAQYNLDDNYRQSTTENKVTFSEDTGWEYTPGPKEIDIQFWSSNPKKYVNEYVGYLRDTLNDNNVTGNLITVNELGLLGCIVPEDYSIGNENWGCANSTYKSWLINNQFMWTRSANVDYAHYVWIMIMDGGIYGNAIISGMGVRPTITISKETLRNLG